jgi:hypothetical protein
MVVGIFVILLVLLKVGQTIDRSVVTAVGR